jgi:hypothetical protein
VNAIGGPVVNREAGDDDQGHAQTAGHPVGRCLFCRAHLTESSVSTLTWGWVTTAWNRSSPGPPRGWTASRLATTRDAA